MGYEAAALVIEQDRILCPDLGSEVMMDWERAIMRAHADVVTHNRGDVLEIGFGLGISAGFIHERRPRTHTIVECHPQVLERARPWARAHGATLVEGDWYAQRGRLGTYDGIFYDAIHDPAFRRLPEVVPRLAKPGCRFTWFNDYPRMNRFGLHADYLVLAVDPPPNQYFNNPHYYLPIVRY